MQALARSAPLAGNQRGSCRVACVRGAWKRHTGHHPVGARYRSGEPLRRARHHDRARCTYNMRPDPVCQCAERMKHGAAIVRDCYRAGIRSASSSRCRLSSIPCNLDVAGEPFRRAAPHRNANVVHAGRSCSPRHRVSTGWSASGVGALVDLDLRRGNATIARLSMQPNAA
jgi:hypothetical protein